MPEAEEAAAAEEVTEVTGEQDGYLSYDTEYINEKLLSIDNKLGDIAAKLDHFNEVFTPYNETVREEIAEISEQFTVLGGAVADRNNYDKVYDGALSMMLGFLVGILLIGKFWK